MIPATKPSRKGDHLRWGESMREDIEGGQARLIEAALFCYRRFGPPHTRVVDVALQAHVTRVTFYRYFRNGDDLLHATLKRELTRLWRSTIEQVSALTPSHDVPIEAVLVFLHQIKQPEYQFLAHIDTLPALGSCMLDTGYLNQNAPLIAPLLRAALPAGGLITLFEMMNRAAHSYLRTPSLMFSTDEQLRDLLTYNIAPFTAWLLAAPDAVPALEPAAAQMPLPAGMSPQPDYPREIPPCSF